MNARPPTKEEQEELKKYIDNFLEAYTKENELLLPLEQAVMKSILFGTSKVKIKDDGDNVRIEVINE